MNKYIFLMLPVLFLLSGCESNIKYSPVHELKHEKLSPREAPATVTKKSDDSLRQEGYLEIGEIFIKEVTKTYWADKSYLHLDPCNCPAPAVIKRDFTQEFCRGAASHGGDLVTVTVENKPDKSEVSKHGKPIAWREQTIVVATPHYGRTTGPTGAPVDYTMVTSTTYQTQIIQVPIAWEDVYGIECSIHSVGTVWRHDTELIKWIAERQERLRRIKTEIKERIASSKDLISNKVGDKWGYLDNNGKTVIEPKFEQAWGFSEGLGRIKVGEKFGYIDSTGKVVIEPQFEWAREFSEGVAFVGRGKFLFDWKWGCIDKSGKMLIDYDFNDVDKFSEGLAAAANSSMFKEDRWGYIDKTGGWVIRPSFYDAKEFSEGFASVAIGGLMTKKWGYITKDAQVVIKPQFDDAFSFSEDLAKIKVGNKFGFIDKTGKIIIKPQFDNAEQFIAGWARVEVDGDVGYIDKSEELIFE
jgi:hypothetical protein